jgi:16S rRNA (cytosine967-C5)-methyltransferase
LRQADDINPLKTLQLQILQGLWSTLKPGGILLYATCSILPDENVEVIRQFWHDEPGCTQIPISMDCGLIQEYGRQWLPQTAMQDGFFYALLRKQ